VIKDGQLGGLVGLGIWCLPGKLDFAILCYLPGGGGVGGRGRGERVDACVLFCSVV